jgi:hypothetical protein
MTEMLCEIRAETGDAVGRSSWRSPFLGAPGAGFFCGMENFLGQGRRRPCPKIPSILRRQKENSSYCKCAQQICLTAGVHPRRLCPVLCPPSFKTGSNG